MTSSLISAESAQLPLTEAQQELWLAAKMSETAALSYNVSFIVHLEGELNQTALEDSFRELIARHDSLRTAFDLKEPVQRVTATLDWSLPATDLSEFPPVQADQKLGALARDQGEESFELTCAPLWRLRLVRLGDRKHVLILTVHHLVADGWSVGVLLHELKHLYEARCTGKEHTLAVPLQMSQYVQILAAGDQQKKAALEAEQYWREQFASPPPAIELPADYSRPAVRTYKAARETVGWDAEFSRKLKKTSARQGTTPLNFLLAGFNVLIHRLTGQKDFVVGIPAAGQIAGSIQGVDGARGLVGHCVNLLPVRSECRGDMVFADYLKSLKSTMLDAYDHQEMTLGRLLQLLNVSRDQSRAPLVQVTFNLDRAASVFDMSNVHARAEELSRSALVFDLSVNIVDDERLLTVHCDFNTDLFNATTIKRWLGHFRSLLDAAAERPESLVFDLPLLTPAERRELITEFNKPAQTLSSSQVPLDGEATLHGLFEAQAARSPEAVALRCEGRSLTYGQLNGLANRLARQLVQCGARPDTLVGLCMDRSNELVIALLAILKAGAAYLPIDLAYPADRLAFMLEDAQAPVLLTQTKLTGDLPRTQTKVLCVDELLARPTQAGEEANLPPTACPDNLAYVIYTSGTTGKPKGSMITHRNVVRLFPATEHWYEFNEKDVWTLFHSCAFDFSVWEIWGALLYGGQLVVVPFMVSRSPESFYELVATECVTVLNQTPSAFRQLIQAEEAVGQRELALRYVIFGGEALEMQSLRPWFERHGDQRPQLVNMYGITETTVHVTYRPLSKDDVRSGSMIGVPIPDLQIYFLDPRRQPVPIGVPGEMYVGGAGLARGYLNRRDLTAERFIPDLLSGRPNSWLYCTGDLARLLPGRDIEYLGRIDHQVKIRGFRVELGEIESVLCEHPAVREAVVLARQDTSGFKRLVAYLVPAFGAHDVNDLRKHLSAKVPDYMVPAAFVMLDKFPLTNNGKVDQKALPEPDQERPEVETQYVAPQSDLEVELAQIWTEVLGIERIGVRDNFFELGGHSLLAVKTISRMRQQLDTDMPLSTFFEAPTVAEMAAKVFELQTEKLDSSDLALLFEGIESPTDDFTG